MAKSAAASRAGQGSAGGVGSAGLVAFLDTGSLRRRMYANKGCQRAADELRSLEASAHSSFLQVPSLDAVLDEQTAPMQTFSGAKGTAQRVGNAMGDAMAKAQDSYDGCVRNVEEMFVQASSRAWQGREEGMTRIQDAAEAALNSGKQEYKNNIDELNQQIVTAKEVVEEAEEKTKETQEEKVKMIGEAGLASKKAAAHAASSGHEIAKNTLLAATVEARSVATASKTKADLKLLAKENMGSALEAIGIACAAAERTLKEEKALVGKVHVHFSKAQIEEAKQKAKEARELKKRDEAAKARTKAAAKAIAEAKDRNPRDEVAGIHPLLMPPTSGEGSGDGSGEDGDLPPPQCGINTDGECERAAAVNPKHKITVCKNGKRVIQFHKTDRRATPSSVGMAKGETITCRGYAHSAAGVHASRAIRCNAQTPQEATATNMWTPTGHDFGCYFDCGVCTHKKPTGPSGVVFGPGGLPLPKLPDIADYKCKSLICPPPAHTCPDGSSLGEPKDDRNCPMCRQCMDDVTRKAVKVPMCWKLNIGCDMPLCARGHELIILKKAGKNGAAPCCPRTACRVKKVCPSVRCIAAPLACPTGAHIGVQKDNNGCRLCKTCLDDVTKKAVTVPTCYAAGGHRCLQMTCGKDERVETTVAAGAAGAAPCCPEQQCVAHSADPEQCAKLTCAKPPHMCPAGQHLGRSVLAGGTAAADNKSCKGCLSCLDKTNIESKPAAIPVCFRKHMRCAAPTCPDGYALEIKVKAGEHGAAPCCPEYSCATPEEPPTPCPAIKCGPSPIACPDGSSLGAPITRTHGCQLCQTCLDDVTREEVKVPTCYSHPVKCSPLRIQCEAGFEARVTKRSGEDGQAPCCPIEECVPKIMASPEREKDEVQVFYDVQVEGIRKSDFLDADTAATAKKEFIHTIAKAVMLHDEKVNIVSVQEVEGQLHAKFMLLFIGGAKDVEALKAQVLKDVTPQFTAELRAQFPDRVFALKNVHVDARVKPSTVVDDCAPARVQKYLRMCGITTPGVAPNRDLLCSSDCSPDALCDVGTFSPRTFVKETKEFMCKSWGKTGATGGAARGR